MFVVEQKRGYIDPYPLLERRVRVYEERGLAGAWGWGEVGYVDSRGSRGSIGLWKFRRGVGLERE